MRSIRIAAGAFAAALALAAPAAAETTVMVGGAPMFPSKTIVENAVNSKAHTTLVAAVKAAGLVETLASPGPFTVFAPVNDAFAALPAGTVDTLLKPENKAMLTQVLTYHVVPGDYSGRELLDMIRDAGGTLMLDTAAGEKLTLTRSGKWTINVVDAKGGRAKVTIADVDQSNGVIHVIDKVLIPG